MSTQPPKNDPGVMTLPRLAEMKRAGEPIVMVTAYDYPSAQMADEAGVDVVLVGDTAAMVVLGYDATTPVGMDEMLMMAGAVRRGLERPLLIGDMPFGSYESSNEQAIENAQRFVKDRGHWLRRQFRIGVRSLTAASDRGQCGRWRRAVYRRRWYPAMATAKLTVTFDRHTVLPVLKRVRCRPGRDGRSRRR